MGSNCSSRVHHVDLEGHTAADSGICGQAPFLPGDQRVTIMSSRGGKKKSTKTSRSAKAGVIFPVGRMLRYIKKGHPKYRIGVGAPVYMAAVLEYLTETGIGKRKAVVMQDHLCCKRGTGPQGGQGSYKMGPEGQAVLDRDEGSLEHADRKVKAPGVTCAGLQGRGGPVCIGAAAVAVAEQVRYWAESCPEEPQQALERTVPSQGLDFYCLSRWLCMLCWGQAKVPDFIPSVQAVAPENSLQGGMQGLSSGNWRKGFMSIDLLAQDFAVASKRGRLRKGGEASKVGYSSMVPDVPLRPSCYEDSAQGPS
ncbi:Core histone macro-H2A.1 [Plecturocebus cupreus]